jgi:hypothetical protein
VRAPEPLSSAACLAGPCLCASLPHVRAASVCCRGLCACCGFPSLTTAATPRAPLPGPAAVAAQQRWLHWFGHTLVGSIFPGASHQRSFMALQLLQLLLDAFGDLLNPVLVSPSPTGKPNHLPFSRAAIQQALGARIPCFPAGLLLDGSACLRAPTLLNRLICHCCCSAPAAAAACPCCRGRLQATLTWQSCAPKTSMPLGPTSAHPAPCS